MRLLIYCIGPAFAFCLPAAALANADEQPEELVLSGDNIIKVTINGRPMRLQVRPDGAGIPTINTGVAAELKLKPGLFGARIAIGPEIVTANTAVHKIDFGGDPGKRRIMWANHDVSSIADGVISPASMPYRRVVFQLRPAVDGETIYSFPLDKFGFFGRGGMGANVKLRDEKLLIIFSLNQNENLAAAPTGNWLAENFDGSFTGKPQSTLVYFGIARPTRPMTLKQPLSIGHFSLTSLAVRVRDYGNAEAISDATIADETAQAEETGDGDEIVVTGKRKKNVDLRLTIGRDQLASCSTLTYDLGRDEIRLSCAL